MPEMLSIGECLIELFSEEPIQKASTFNRSLAGDSFNILVAASRLGTKTGYITNFGDDPFESYLRETLTSEGIDVSNINVVEGFNAVHFVAVKPDGDRDFVYYRKGSAVTTIRPEDLDESYISQSKIMHCSGIGQAISLSTKATGCERHKSRNKMVSPYLMILTTATNYGHIVRQKKVWKK